MHRPDQKLLYRALGGEASESRWSARRVRLFESLDSLSESCRSDAVTDAPAWVRNGRHDLLAANRMARALRAHARRPANTARFVYLDPASQDFVVDWERAAAILRSEAGRTRKTRRSPS